MKRLRRKILSVALAVCCFANLCGTAQAAPGEECQIAFSVTDNTGGIFIDDITVTLLSLDAGKEYTFEITSADYLFGGSVNGTVQQGDYNIALSYPSKGDFTVTNADGTAITSFSANGSEHAFAWVVEYTGGMGADQSQDATADQYIAETGNEEADALWNAFLDEVSALETDSRYSAILKTTQNTAEFDAKYYAKTTGNSEEEYLGMSTFEQFLWYSTYIEPVNAITAGDYDYNCSSLDNWLSHAVSISHNLLKTFGNSEMVEAYKALMEWDYQYFLEHGAVYNFMTGKSSSEENSAVEVTTPDDGGDNLTDEEIQEITDALEGELTDEELEQLEDELAGEGEKGVWDDTKALVKENAGTIAILLVLVGALCAVVIYRKKKTIDDE